MDFENEFAAYNEKIKSVKAGILSKRAMIKTHKQSLQELEKEINRFNEASSNLQKPGNSLSEAEGGVRSKYMTDLHDITKDLFKPMTVKNNNAFRKVDVFFKARSIRFIVNSRDTFKDLSYKAASYLGLKVSETFFADSDSEDALVYQSEENIFYEMFHWKKLSLRFAKPVLYIIEAKTDHYSFLKENISEVPFILESELIEQTDVGINKCDEKTATTQVYKRYKRNSLINLFQCLLMLGFWIMWMSTILSEQNITNSSWMNDSILRIILKEKLVDSNNSIFNDKPNNHFFKIYNDEGIWSYLEDEKNRLIRIQNGLYETYNHNYEALEFRQVRSDLSFCEVEDYGTVECSEKYSFNHNEEDFSTQTEGFLYDSDGDNILIVGGIDHYNADGFKTEFSYTDLSGWGQQIQDLVSNNWIDVQTRAVFITSNIVNPYIGLLTSAVQMIEIGPHRNYTPYIKLYAFNYDVDEVGFGFFHGTLLIWVITMLLLELRSNYHSYEEVIFSEKKEFEYLKDSLSPAQLEKEMKKLLENWTSHDKKHLFQRFRKPRYSELIQICVFLFALLLNIVSDIWYLATINSLEMNEDQYTNLLGILQTHSIFSDFKLIVGIILTGVLCSNIVKFLGFLQDFIQMLKAVLLETGPLILCIYTFLLLFSNVFYFVYGPYYYFAWNFQLAFIQCLSMVFGNFDLDPYFYMFNLHWEVYSIVILMKVLSFAVFLVFIVSVYMELLEVRTFHIAKIRKENKAKNRVLRLKN